MTNIGRSYSDPASGHEQSVYALGAADGLWIGLTMSLCAVCIIFMYSAPVLCVPAVGIFVATPFFAWVFQRRAWISQEVPATLSAVWLHGICMFLFGSLILALVVYICLRFIEPCWVATQLSEAARQLATDPSTAQQAMVVNRIIENGALPSAISIAVSTVWVVGFTGSMWSMIFAIILTKTRHFAVLRREGDF